MENCSKDICSSADKVTEKRKVGENYSKNVFSREDKLSVAVGSAGKSISKMYPKVGINYQ